MDEGTRKRENPSKDWKSERGTLISHVSYEIKFQEQLNVFLLFLLGSRIETGKGLSISMKTQHGAADGENISN